MCPCQRCGVERTVLCSANLCGVLVRQKVALQQHKVPAMCRKALWCVCACRVCQECEEVLCGRASAANVEEGVDLGVCPADRRACLAPLHVLRPRLRPLRMCDSVALYVFARRQGLRAEEKREKNDRLKKKNAAKQKNHRKKERSFGWEVMGKPCTFSEAVQENREETRCDVKCVCKRRRGRGGERVLRRWGTRAGWCRWGRSCS